MWYGIFYICDTWYYYLISDTRYVIHDSWYVIDDTWYVIRDIRDTWYVIRDTWYVIRDTIRDTWYVIRDTWYVICDTWSQRVFHAKFWHWILYPHADREIPRRIPRQITNPTPSPTPKFESHAEFHAKNWFPRQNWFSMEFCTGFWIPRRKYVIPRRVSTPKSIWHGILHPTPNACLNHAFIAVERHWSGVSNHWSAPETTCSCGTISNRLQTNIFLECTLHSNNKLRMWWAEMSMGAAGTDSHNHIAKLQFSPICTEQRTHF